MFNFFKKQTKRYCLKVNDLTVKYGKKLVLKKVDFTVGKGDLFGIIGLSGSGKSTILKSILRLIRYKGRIDFNEKGVGFCPQEDAFFYELSIKENAILFGSLQRIKYTTIITRLKHYMKELELDEPLSKLAGELSGGQRKRLNIILSILKEPGVIILDEPFAGLDYLNRLLLWRFITKLKKRGKTIILTTHLLEEAEDYCNKILIIKEGKRFALGSISDLKRRFKFKLYARIKVSYISAALLEKIKYYSKKRNIRVLSVFNNEISLGFPGEDIYENFLKFIERSGKEYKVIELKPPTLNELFLVSLA